MRRYTSWAKILGGKVGTRVCKSKVYIGENRMSFRPISPSIKLPNNKPVKPREVVLVRDVHSGSRKRPRNDTVRIFIGVELLREARYVPGDRIGIQVDTDTSHKVCLLSRVSGANGWKLLPSSGKLTNHKAGAFTRGYIAFTPAASEMSTFFPNGVKRYAADNISVRDEGILFDLAS